MKTRPITICPGSKSLRMVAAVGMLVLMLSALTVGPAASGEPAAPDAQLSAVDVFYSPT